MKKQSIFSLAIALGTSLLLPGCFSAVDAPPAKRAEEVALAQQPVLTAELGKKALLDLMRNRPEVLVNRFDVKEWSTAALVKTEDGWYDFGGAFRIQPEKCIYILTVRPAPEARACTFEWEGSFSFEKGRWVAQPPSKLLSSALGGGE